MTIDEINMQHDKGLMPDWAWTQQNGRSAQENYNYIKEKQQKEYAAARREKQQNEALEKYVYEMIEEKLGDCLDSALNDLLKDLK